MTIAEQLEDALKKAMLAKDKPLLSCLRQVKAKAQEAANAPGFVGQQDDAFYRDIIGRYGKMLSKSLAELDGGGERGQTLARSYRDELAYLARYLPQPLSDLALGEAVDKLLAGGQFGSKDVGRAMGQLLGQFKGQLEPARARQALTEAMAGRTGNNKP